MTERALTCVLWFALLTGSAASAEAQALEPVAEDAAVEGPEEQPTPAVAVQAEEDFRLQWTFPKVRPVEYVVGLGLPVAFRIINHNTFDARRPRWTGGNFFDDGVEGLIGRNDEDTRRLADIASDVTWYTTMAYPFVDTLLVTLVLDGNPDVAWQMTAINIGAMAVNGFVTLLAIRATARSRPKTEICLEQGGSFEECRGDDVRSFPSGHTAGSFTGAGLTCAHHLAMPLYGGGLADGAACVGALTLATGTALFRVVADKHHMIDVIAGAAIGLGSGWLLPWLLHYGHGPEVDLEPSSADSDGPALTLVPFTDGQSAAGLAAAGAW